jgi:hypothetical protein
MKLRWLLFFAATLLLSNRAAAQTVINTLRIIPTPTHSAVGTLQFAALDNLHAISLKAPATLLANYTWTLPITGSTGCLQDLAGAGTLIVAACPTGTPGVTYTPGPGISIVTTVISNTGILAITPSTGVHSSLTAGVATLSIGQAVETTSSPTFASETLSGVLTVNGGAVTINGAAGTGRNVNFQTAGVARWSLFADSASETGSDSGSNICLQNYHDGGSAFSTCAMQINRATGIVTFQAGSIATIYNALTLGSTATENTNAFQTSNGSLAATGAGNFYGQTFNARFVFNSLADEPVRVVASITSGGALTRLLTATAWNSATAYVVGDVAQFGSSVYIANSAGTNHQPDTSPAFWGFEDVFNIGMMNGKLFIGGTCTGTWPYVVCSGGTAYTINTATDTGHITISGWSGGTVASLVGYYLGNQFQSSGGNYFVTQGGVVNAQGANLVSLNVSGLGTFSGSSGSTILTVVNSGAGGGLSVSGPTFLSAPGATALSVTSGDVSMAGSAAVSGNFGVVGTLSVTGVTTLGVYHTNGNIVLNNSITGTGNIGITGSIFTTGTLQANSATTLQSTLGVVGLGTFSNGLTVAGGTATFNGSMAGTHAQNLGTADNVTHAVITATSLSITGIGSVIDSSANYLANSIKISGITTNSGGALVCVTGAGLLYRATGGAC